MIGQEHVKKKIVTNSIVVDSSLKIETLNDAKDNTFQLFKIDLKQWTSKNTQVRNNLVGYGKTLSSNTYSLFNTNDPNFPLD